MPTKRAPKGYRVLNGITYPKTLAIRDRIRGGDHMPMEERGEWVRHAKGDKITNPPRDLIKSWLRRDLVEPINAKKKEASDGA